MQISFEATPSVSSQSGSTTFKWTESPRKISDVVGSNCQIQACSEFEFHTVVFQNFVGAIEATAGRVEAQTPQKGKFS